MYIYTYTRHSNNNSNSHDNPSCFDYKEKGVGYRMVEI